MINEYDSDSSGLNDLFDENYEIKRRKQFSHREVGLNHPDNSSFIRIADGGAIEIFSCPGVGIVINPGTRSISLFADNIKFYCKDDDGLRWNSMSFNPASDVYNEPALIKTNQFENNPAFYNSIRYLNNLEEMEQSGPNIPVTIGGEYGFSRPQNPVESPLDGSEENYFSPELDTLIKNYAQSNSDIKVQKLIEFLKNGYSFNDSIQKLNNFDYNNSENLENFPWIHNDME